MNNDTKIELIRYLITDFWDYNDKEQQIRGACCLITAIYSVLDFGEGAKNED